MQKITPFLWFDSQAAEAAQFYTSVFKNGKILNTTHYSETGQEVTGQKPGTVMTVEFELFGQHFTALNGGPLFKFNESISFVVACEDQAEIDDLWSELSAVPASEQCGWLKDKFGVSWQIVPRNMNELIQTPASIEAMLKMKKINIAELEAAVNS